MSVMAKKVFLINLQKQFSDALATSPDVAKIPKEQLESLGSRLNEIGPKSEVRAVRLKFLEHKVPRSVCRRRCHKQI